MVIVDSTVWVDYLRGAQTPEVAWLDAELDQQLLGLAVCRRNKGEGVPQGLFLKISGVQAASG